MDDPRNFDSVNRSKRAFVTCYCRLLAQLFNTRILMKQMKLMMLAVAGLVTASVAGCSSTGGYQSPEYRLSKGSTIELMQTLHFSSGSARTYIQDGNPQSWNDLNLWKAYCSFGLNSNRDHKPLAHEIQPTKFTIGGTRLGVYAALDPSNPPAVDPDNVFARRGVEVAGLFSGGGNAGFPYPYTFTTTMSLFSEQEPQVADLTCAFNGEPADRNLTLTQIQDTLGSVAKIR
ncbi:MAG: hypothetical protein WB783_19760 [Arenicellales bacterium]